jgi:hypothetical protein
MFSASTESLIEAGSEGAGENGASSREREANNEAESSKIDPKSRALVFFTGQLSKNVRARFRSYGLSVSQMVNDSAVEASDLHEMATTLDAIAGRARQQYLMKSASLWASYCAQSRLGSHYSGTRKVSKMQDYFGCPQSDGRAGGTDRSGGDGVLSVVLEIEGPSSRPKLDREQTRIIGLNSELQKYVLSSAGYELARVNLPKEVHVLCHFSHAVIALDETNRIRDVRGWEWLGQDLGLSASEFWKHWGANLEVK